MPTPLIFRRSRSQPLRLAPRNQIDASSWDDCMTPWSSFFRILLLALPTLANMPMPFLSELFTQSWVSKCCMYIVTVVLPRVSSHLAFHSFPPPQFGISLELLASQEAEFISSQARLCCYCVCALIDRESGSCAICVRAPSIFVRVSSTRLLTSEAVRPLVGIGSSTVNTLAVVEV